MALRSAKTDWVQFLRKAGFDETEARKWGALARPNIRLVTGDLAAIDTSLAAATKLGGEPDLPRGLAWPQRAPYALTDQRQRHVSQDAAPLDFLAQINLAEVAAIGCDLPLPSSGLLSFFYDSEFQPWGFDPGDAAGFRVIYTPAGGDLVRLIHPGGVRPALPVRLEASETLPDWAWFFEHHGDEIDDDIDEFQETLEMFDDEQLYEMFDTGHVIGGWPALIQNPMELECQLASNGINVGGPEGYADPRAKALEAGAADWRLLLQLDSEDELDWMWGDAGTLYFWCRKQDIAAARFERAWTILQCT
jgi:uncharacterized protein YwqG